MSRPTVVAKLLAGSAPLVLAAGCGLNTSSSPEPLPEGAVPSELGGQEEDEEATIGSTEVEGEELVHVWVSDTSGEAERLVFTSASVPEGPGPRVVLEQLVDLPAAELSAEQRTTRVPIDTVINDVTQPDSSGEVVVDLSADFYEDTQSGRGRYAYGQVVLTLTNRPGIESVSFLQDGEPVTVVDGEGAEMDGPAMAEDYASITG